MLRNASEFYGAAIHAIDGDMGKAEDLLFEDDTWTARYILANCGNWLFGRKVLLSPTAVSSLDWQKREVCVNLTREQVKNSPDVDTDRPVSRQWEADASDYYGWPYYWGALGYAGLGGSGSGLWGGGAFPGALAGVPNVAIAEVEQAKAEADSNKGRENGDPHLRSVKEVIGYEVGANGERFGTVGDFIVDDEAWALRYLIVHTSRTTAARTVLLPPRLVKSVSWESRNLATDLSGESLLNAPDWDASSTISRSYEESLHDHYGRSGYWQAEPRDKREL